MAGGLTSELLEVIWVLEGTLALEPELELLDEIVSGSRRSPAHDVASNASI